MVSWTKPASNMHVDELRKQYMESMAVISRLRPIIYNMRSQLCAATTYKEIATVADFEAGHARRADILRDLNPLDDEYKIASSSNWRAEVELARREKLMERKI